MTSLSWVADANHEHTRNLNVVEDVELQNLETSSSQVSVSLPEDQFKEYVKQLETENLRLQGCLKNQCLANEKIISIVKPAFPLIIKKYFEELHTYLQENKLVDKILTSSVVKDGIINLEKLIQVLETHNISIKQTNETWTDLGEPVNKSESSKKLCIKNNNGQEVIVDESESSGDEGWTAIESHTPVTIELEATDLESRVEELKFMLQIFRGGKPPLELNYQEIIQNMEKGENRESNYQKLWSLTSMALSGIDASGKGMFYVYRQIFFLATMFGIRMFVSQSPILSIAFRVGTVAYKGFRLLEG